jgi:hypothetical protein
MAESCVARPENVAEILAAAAILLAARVRGSDHAAIDCERRRAIDDAINLYGELMQRLNALPDRSEKKVDAAALLVAVRTLKHGGELESDRVEDKNEPKLTSARGARLPVVETQGSPTTPANRETG